jgi:hypothetical protein
MARTKKFKKFRNKKGKKKGRKTNRFMGKVASRKFSVDYTVYANITNGSNNAPYSLASGAVTLVVNPGWAEAVPSLNMIQSYQVAKLTGVKLCFRRSFPENIPSIDGAQFAALYPMSFNVDYHDVTTSIDATATTIFDTDRNMKIQTINEDSKPISAYWALPKIMPDNVNNGQLWNEWFDLYNSNGLSSFYISLGYPAPNLLNQNATATGAFPVGILTITMYMKFMHAQISLTSL